MPFIGLSNVLFVSMMALESFGISAFRSNLVSHLVHDEGVMIGVLHPLCTYSLQQTSSCIYEAF
jgi:hypothetical protein